MSNKVTIHVIAKALNIDSSTVSRALNNSDRVTKKTKELVLKKAKELGYQRNSLASNLRKNKSYTIGVVVPRISRHFFSSAISGIEEMAYSLGYNVIICQSLEELSREESIINNLISNRVDGVLISVSMETEDGAHLKALKQNNVPLVFFDRHCNALLNTSKVSLDDAHAAYEATNYLIGKGNKRIVHFSGPQTLNIYRERLKGYIKALKENNIPFDEDLVLSSRLMELNGKELTKKIIDNNIVIDAIFSANDLAAIGAIKYLKSIGKKIPDEVSVIGFSNEPVSEVIEPSLTTINQFGLKMGKKACELLIRIINGEALKPHEKNEIIKPELILRESTL